MSEFISPPFLSSAADPELRELEEALRARPLCDEDASNGDPRRRPGIGKTRLLDDRREASRARAPACLSRAGARERVGPRPRRANPPPALPHPRDDGGRERRRSLREEVEQILGNDRVDEFLFFLGAFLDLDFADSPFTKALEDDPRELRRVSQAVLRRAIEVDARQRPMVLVFDDVHQAQD
ncbi:MAG: hypothetical protein R3B99_21870 [Polyangiales bacterium]